MALMVYLNGNLLPVNEACVSVLDRGFLFGDGVYEVIPVYQGRVFRLTQHIQRLARSLEAVSIPFEMSEQAWSDLIEKVIASNNLQGKDVSIYVQVTRGVDSKRDHAFPEKTCPTLFVMASPVVFGGNRHPVKGISAVTLPDNRWTNCFIKSICLLPNVMLKHQASEQAAEEVVLIRDGYVTEASAANVFVVKDELLMTPPKDNLILGGVTRDLIVELAGQSDFRCHEVAVSEQQLLQADEVWITSSTREIVPVVRLNDNPVGTGEVGPMWYTVSRCFQSYKKRLIEQP